MEREETDRIVAEISELVRTRYVFPEVGERVARRLDEAVRTGRYAAVTDPATLASVVTEDLQRCNDDSHLQLIHHPRPLPDLPEGAALNAVIERRVHATMSGIGRIERLAGNIGLLEIEPALFGVHLVGDEIAAAMRVLRHTEALIIDLRHCIGSDPGALAYFCTYLLPSGTHLTDVYDRAKDLTRQYWTLPHVPGPRYGTERPVYVLTSRQTYSGGEALAHDLRHAGRVTLVGEVTAGGAHPRIGVRVHPNLEAGIPTSRSINPVTGTDWEGVGVVPDIEAPADGALKVAHAAALDRISLRPPVAAGA
ncbi:S41 family peptidase [Streptomyces sp. NPDC094437]|uniref:S41 family peptidase n=1 Tax=Streptomyces sp. NPDC094437 TaxID=3366060 RepID=UPI00381A2232